MKEITIDGIEYVLLKKEKATLEPVEEDKYKKIREVVSRNGDALYIHGKKKTLISNEYGEIYLKNTGFQIGKLHFEECTLGDLKENDVFVFENGLNNGFTYSDVRIITVLGSILDINYLSKDVIRHTTCFMDISKVIKILRH